MATPTVVDVLDFGILQDTSTVVPLVVLYAYADGTLVNSGNVEAVPLGLSCTATAGVTAVPLVMSATCTQVVLANQPKGRGEIVISLGGLSTTLTVQIWAAVAVNLSLADAVLNQLQLTALANPTAAACGSHAFQSSVVALSVTFSDGVSQVSLPPAPAPQVLLIPYPVPQYSNTTCPRLLTTPSFHASKRCCPTCRLILG